MLKFLYSNVYSLVKGKCESHERILKQATLSEATSESLRAFGIGREQLLEELSLDKKHLVEDSPEALMRYYFDECMPVNEYFFWYEAARKSHFIKDN